MGNHMGTYELIKNRYWVIGSGSNAKPKFIVDYLMKQSPSLTLCAKG
jgi:hypothetical protein